MVQKIMSKKPTTLSGIGKKESYATVIGYPFDQMLCLKNLK